MALNTGKARAKFRRPNLGASISIAVILGAAILLGLQVNTPVFAGSILFKQGVVHTVSGPSLTNSSILIREDRIAAVGTDIAETADETVDLKGAHVFPGLIAVTTVLGLLEIDSVRATRDTTEVGEFTPDVMAWTAVNPDSELIPVARANGITHAEVIPIGTGVSGWSAVIRLSGWTIEDLAVNRTAALHLFWPTFSLDTTPKELSANRDSWKSIEDQVKERDRKVKAIDDFFLDAEAYAKARQSVTNQSGATKGDESRVPAWEMMLPIVRRERPLYIHADDLRQIVSAVEWGRKRNYQTVIAGGRDSARCAELLSSNKVSVAFEHVFTLPARDVDGYDAYFSTPGILSRAGVKVAFTEGTDQFGASNIRNIPYHAAQAVAFGMPPLEALRGLTLYPAEILGMADRIGSIEPGKEASFFVANGDILDVRTQVLRMWIAGKEVDLSSRHTRLYERYRVRPKK